MDVVDITVIGSGIASTVTLVEVFGKLLSNSPAHKIAITVVEKNKELFKGIPYGSRSSVNALTITSVYDFINEQERPVFFAWLKSNVNEWAAWYKERGGITAARWLQNNLPLVEKEDWETIYVPRFLFGNYLQQKVTKLQKAVEEKQLADVTYITAEATDVKAIDGGLYDITLENRDGHTDHIICRKLVIAAGSAPVRSMYDNADAQVLYLNDIYEPSVADNLHTITDALDGAGDNNILIIGSNASSIELLYLLEGMPELRALINKTVIISPSGILPYHTSTAQLTEHPLPRLSQLRVAGEYDIKTLSVAAMEDLKLAVVNGANMDYVASVVKHTLELMEPLGEDARKEFYNIHGVRLRDMFRRSGPEYKGGSQVLIDGNEATVLRGRFTGTKPAKSGVLMNYLDVDGKEQTYPLSFKVIINCSGSDDLQRSSSRLLASLVNSGICKGTLSNKGIEVNEHFEAAPNLYIMGPLLAGNVNKLIHFWQLENASRLTGLAPHLADELLK